jgi:hypothetical protein
MPAFLWRWLSRSQDRGGQPGASTPERGGDEGGARIPGDGTVADPHAPAVEGGSEVKNTGPMFGPANEDPILRHMNMSILERIKTMLVKRKQTSLEEYLAILKKGEEMTDLDVARVAELAMLLDISEAQIDSDTKLFAAMRAAWEAQKLHAQRAKVLRDAENAVEALDLQTMEAIEKIRSEAYKKRAALISAMNAAHQEALIFPQAVKGVEAYNKRYEELFPNLPFGNLRDGIGYPAQVDGKWDKLRQSYPPFGHVLQLAMP